MENLGTPYTGIVQNWFDAAKGNYKTSERETLYKNTKLLVGHLLNNERDIKIKELCQVLIKEFESHQNESEKLTEWVADHSGYGTKKDTITGAYESLHNLFVAIARVNYQYTKQVDFDIAHLDSESLKKIEEHHKKPIPNLTQDVQIATLSKLPTKDLLSMRSNSKYNRSIINQILIDRLNKGEITPFHLEIKTTHVIDVLIKFFGDDCSKITELNLENYGVDHDIDKIAQSFPNLKYLTLHRVPIKIDLTASSLNLQKFETDNLNFLKLCPNLTSLNLADGYYLIKDIDFLKFCPNLTNLDLPTDSKIEDISSLKVNCPKLETLSLINCKKIKNIEALELPNLTSLNIRGCEVENLNFLEDHPKLVNLELEGCYGVQDISPLKYCTGLSSLNLKGLDKIGDFSVLNECPDLKSLKLESNTITDLSFLKFCSNLTDLELDSCTQIKDFNLLSLCPNLKSLNLRNCPQIDDINFLKAFEKLISLDLSGCTGIHDFSPLETLSELKILKAAGCDQIHNTDFLEQLQSLISLVLYRCRGIENFSLEGLPNLESLNLVECSEMRNFSIKNCNSLKDLNLFECSQLDNIDLKDPLDKITSLNLRKCEQLTNFKFLEQCKALKSLDLSECSHIENFSFLKLCPDLTHLYLMNCDQIQNVRFLENCSQKLIHLSLKGNSIGYITDIFYDNYPKLKSLDIRNCYRITQDEIESLREEGIDVLR